MIVEIASQLAAHRAVISRVETELSPLIADMVTLLVETYSCLLYTSPSPRDGLLSRMPSSA